MKSYHFPGLSVVAPGRVVHDTENIRSGKSRNRCTRVDFPEPDGPETMMIRGRATE